LQTDFEFHMKSLGRQKISEHIFIKKT